MMWSRFILILMLALVSARPAPELSLEEIEKGTKTKEACFDDSITISCEALNGVRGTVVDVDWKAFDPKTDAKWIRFGYCNQHMNCKVMTAQLPNGIKVLNIVNGTLVLKGSVNNTTNSQSRLLCQVHYGQQDSVAHDEVKINFTACQKSTVPGTLPTMRKDESSPGLPLSKAARSPTQSVASAAYRQVAQLKIILGVIIPVSFFLGVVVGILMVKQGLIKRTRCRLCRSNAAAPSNGEEVPT